MSTGTGTNNPRFAQGSGFFEVIGLSTAAGAVAGYAGAWGAIALVKTGAFLPYQAILAAVHAAGIMPPTLAPYLAAGAAIGAIAGVAAGYFAADIKHEIHIRGRKLENVKAAAKALRPGKKTEHGITIDPQIKSASSRNVGIFFCWAVQDRARRQSFGR